MSWLQVGNVVNFLCTFCAKFLHFFCIFLGTKRMKEAEIGWIMLKYEGKGLYKLELARIDLYML